MPPKGRKKADPEELKAQFEQWKNGDEYKLMEKIGVVIKEKLGNMNMLLTSTSKDFPGSWQTELNMIFELFKMLKVKCGKVKSLEHPFVRSFFFARQDTEKKQEIIDGIYCGVSKELSDTAVYIRQRFCDIIDNCKDSLDVQTPDTFSVFRKDLQKKMQEFVKFYATHCKNGHKIIYEQNMSMVLRPLKELIDINYTYRSFHHCFIKEVDKTIRDFKLRAIEEKYIKYFQEVLRVLYVESEKPYKDNEDPKLRKETPINCCPDIHKLFYKINIKEWKENPIEKLYLEPLHKAFWDLQKTLWRLWYDGIGYWKIPLYKNTEMIDNMQTLINAEMITERLIGNELKRDQLNFIYQVVKIIEQSDSMIKENMKSKDANTLQKSIPKLAVYKAIQRMRKFKDRKKEDIEKSNLLSTKMLELQDLRKQEEEKSPIKQANRDFSHSHSMSATFNKEKEEEKKPSSPKKSDKKKKIEVVNEEEEEGDERTQKKDEEKYGRYWIFEGLVDESKRAVFEECSELIKNINLAVQQDIDDQIINEGMKPVAKRGSEQSQKAAQYSTIKNEQDNADQTTINSRPPFLWNYPKILEHHKFRSIADPDKCYYNDLNNRIEVFMEKLNMLAEHIKVYTADKLGIWDNLIDRTIDVFRQEYNKDAKNLATQEFHIDAEKIKWE